MELNKQKKNNKLKAWFLEYGFYTIAVTSAFTVLLFLCGPLYIFFPNSGEIWVSLPDVLITVGIASLIVFLTLTVFCFMLKDKISEAFVLLIFGAIMGMFVQGMINVQYGSGVLDGSEIEWSKYYWYGVIDSIIWGFCILIPFIIRRVFSKKYKKIIIAASGFLILMQLSALAVQVLQYKPNKQISITKDKIYEMASDSNMLIFIIDTMDEAFYKEFIDKNKEYTDNLEGFVHYDNTLASGARTIMGMPTMLSGIPFRNEYKYSDYISSIWGGNNPLRSIHDSGVNIGVYSDSMLFSSDAAEYIVNFSDREAELKSHYALAKKLYKLTGFAYFPHFIKPFFYKKAADFASLKKGDNLYNGDDVEFCNSFRKTGGYRISDEYPKALRIYHLSGVHKPYTLDSKGKRKKKTSRTEQVEGCFKIISYFLDDLKQKKLYDPTYIIIAADHGGVNLCENPLLLIKQPDQKGSYYTSHVPVSNFDLPICMSEYFGTKVDYGEFGSSIKDLYEGQERERHLFYNYKGNMHLQVNEYVTTGAADDPESIILYQEYQDNRNGDSPYEFGTKLLFDADGSANDYCVEGILGSQGWQSVMHGPVSIMKIPIREVPKGENFIITMGTGDELLTSEVLNYNVFVNGVMVFQGNTDKKTLNHDIKITVPVGDVLSQDDKNIEIKWVFPDIDESEMEMDLMKRTITYPLRSICVDVE